MLVCIKWRSGRGECLDSGAPSLGDVATCAIWILSFIQPERMYNGNWENNKVTPDDHRGNWTLQKKSDHWIEIENIQNQIATDNLEFLSSEWS